MKRLFPSIFLSLGLSTAAMADAPFNIDITVGNVSKSFFFSKVADIFDQVDQDELKKVFRNYDETAAARADIDYRGLPLNLEFVKDSSTLIFKIPSLNIDEIFMEATRNASVKKLEKYLKSEGGDILNRIQRALIAQSPVDPIAGNPSSMMGTMVSEQFQNGFGDQTTNIAAAAEVSASEEERNPENLVHFGTRFGQYVASGKKTSALTVPLGYSFNLQDGDGLRSIDFSLPITLTDTEGASSANVSLGIGLTYAINSQWRLSPAAGVGVAGSIDLGSAGGIGSLSLTSAYTLPRDGWSLNIGNMVGYYETLSFKFRGYDFNPGVSNVVLRNGLVASIPSSLGERKVATEFWVVDTRFFGSELYSEFYDEFGISFGLARTGKKHTIKNYLRGGISYQAGDGVKGYRVNFGYSF